MRKSELEALSQRLSQLADALGARAPSPAGLMVWLDALAEFNLADVQSVLTDWPKANTKMPAPADIVKACRTLVSTRIDRHGEANAADGRRPVQFKAANPKDPAYLAFRLRWGRAPAIPTHADPKAWAKRLRDEGSPDGQPLLQCQRDAIRVALNELPPRAALDEAERELLEERAAIQAEATT